MDAPNEFQPLMDDIFREKVRWARAEKVAGSLSLSGLDLFEQELEQMRRTIRAQFPNFTTEETEAEICRRIKRTREIEERGFYSLTLPTSNR